MNILNRNQLIHELSQHKIAKKARIWKLIPLAGRNRFSTTFSDKIYLTPQKWEDWRQLDPKNSTIALVAHEVIHIEQFLSDKHFKKNYLTDTHYRLQVEAEAYATQAYIREVLGTSRGVEYYLNKYASILTNNYKLGMPFQRVYREITEHYNRIKRTNNK